MLTDWREGHRCNTSVLATVTAELDEARAQVAAVRAVADGWQAKADTMAPPDDWGDSIESTVGADYLRACAARIDGALDSGDAGRGGGA